MWLFTSFGFYSVVLDRTGKKLMVRARARDDLDRLRDAYLPSLSKTMSSPKLDYPFRAFAKPTLFARAAAKIAKDIDYPNFKARVAKQMGEDRAHLYEKVWAVMRKVPPEPPVIGGIVPIGTTPTPAQRRRALRLLAQDKQRRPATRSDWKTTPLPALHSTIALDRRLSDADMRRLRFGIIPQQMEDKWFAFLEGNELFLHRSWTGYCVYVLHLVKRANGMHAVAVDVNRDSEQYRGGPAAMEAAKLGGLVEHLLLRMHRSSQSDTPEVIAKAWGWRPTGAKPPGRRSAPRRLRLP